MKVVLDVETNENLQDNAVIVKRKDRWVAVDREVFLAEHLGSQAKINKAFEERLAKCEENVVKLAKIVKGA